MQFDFDNEEEAKLDLVGAIGSITLPILALGVNINITSTMI